MPRLLIIAYYFPPWGMGGVQRVLKFAKYLPEFGWDVTVVAPTATDYHAQDATLLDELPDSVRVERVDYADKSIGLVGPIGPILPAARWLSSWRDFPDRHREFANLAVIRVRQLMKESGFDIVLTSSPPPSVHRAGLALSRDIRWIADFRDPWQSLNDDYGPTILHGLINRSAHKAVLSRAEAVVTATPQLARRFMDLGPALHIETIRNGYDEMDYTWGAPTPSTGDKLWIGLPGTFSRFSDPLPAFRAIAAWRRKHSNVRLHVLHVGATMGIDIDGGLRACDLLDVYEDIGYVNHRRAVAEMAFADVLMIAYTNPRVTDVSVPGRIYEMLRSQRPIVAFTPTEGALASLLRSQPGCVMVPPDDHAAEATAIDRALESPVRPLDAVRQFDRRIEAGRLSELCLEVIRARS